VKEIEWPEGVEQMVLVFGREHEAIEEGKVKARGHLVNVKLGACQIRFEHEAQQQDEITVLEDASGLIYGVQQQNHDCKLEAMVKIKLVSKIEAVTIVSHKKDLKERGIDCTDYDEMIWIMQGTDWSHYRAKDRPISKWFNKMEDLTIKVEDLFEVHLVWQRSRNKHMLMEELLCPVINTITSEVKVSVIDFYKYKRQAESDSDYESDGERVECCWVMDAQYRECEHSQE
jgi:hypothetical protein